MLIKNIYVVLTCLAILNACSSDRKSKRSAPEAAETSDQADQSKNDNALPLIVRQDVVVRNFDQYNATLSTVTEVSTAAVKDVFERLRSQLPSNKEYEAFSAFNQIAATNLAFEYCDLYVDKHKTQFEVMENNQYIDFITSSFLDRSSAEIKDLDIKKPLVTLMSHDGLVRNNSRLNLQKVGCTTLLSSAWFMMY